MNKEEVINAILNIPRNNNLTINKSLSDLVKESGYHELNDSISVKDIQDMIEKSPEYIQEWEIYCEDKRTSSGWAITYRKGTNKYIVGFFPTEPQEKWVEFSNHAEATAFFIKNEVDSIMANTLARKEKSLFNKLFL